MRIFIRRAILIILVFIFIGFVLGKQRIIPKENVYIDLKTQYRESILKVEHKNPSFEPLPSRETATPLEPSGDLSLNLPLEVERSLAQGTPLPKDPLLTRERPLFANKEPLKKDQRDFTPSELMQRTPKSMQKQDELTEKFLQEQLEKASPNNEPIFSQIKRFINNLLNSFKSKPQNKPTQAKVVTPPIQKEEGDPVLTKENLDQQKPPTAKKKEKVLPSADFLLDGLLVSGAKR